MRLHRTLTIIFFLSCLFGGAFFTYHFIVRAATDATISATATISVCGNGIKEGGEQCDGSDFDANLCTTYAFSGGSLACEPSCELNTSSCTTDAETTAIPLFTTGVGGSYQLNNLSGNGSFSISLPTDYYSHDVRLQMFSYANAHFVSSKPAPGGLSFVGKTYDIVVIDDNSDVVPTLTNAATIVLTYTNDDVSDIDESSLQVYRWGSGDSSWQAISGVSVDTGNNTVTFSTKYFSSFALFGTPPEAEPPAQSGGGGGGGGGAGSGGGPATANSSVIFSGLAYPSSEVVLLKDVQVVTTTVSNADGRFSVRVDGLAVGSYTFVLYSVGEQGRRSTLSSVSLSVASNTIYQKEDIFLSPTIAVDKLQVKQGEPVTIFGRTFPHGEVLITLRSEEGSVQQFYTEADSVGWYEVVVDSGALGYGTYIAQAMALFEGLESRVGRSLLFDVGDTTKWNAVALPLQGDMNKDGRVNLVDFSILAYWYKRPNPVSTVDLNGDGKVDLVDFSILAFHWTG